MKIPTAVKPGLFFGVWMSFSLIASHLFQMDHRTTSEVIKGVISGLMGGLFGGLFFGWAMYKFTHSRRVEEQTHFDPEPGESICIESKANYWRVQEALGGKLYLTTRRLVFKSHAYNIQNASLSIDLADILNVESHKSLGFIPNGLTITLKDSQLFKFVVESPGKWLETFAQVSRTS